MNSLKKIFYKTKYMVKKDTKKKSKFNSKMKAFSLVQQVLM
jgi:hypothetical protein